MTIVKRFVAVVLATLFATMPRAAPPDWMANVPLRDSSAPVQPADGATVEQTPPDFSWPHRGPGVRYEFELVGPDGRAGRRATGHHNWIAWDEALPPGRYGWRVRALVSKDDERGEDSRIRHFTVPAAAVPFVVPPWRVLYERARAAPHPRALPPQGRAAFETLLAGERRRALAGLLSQVDAQLREPLSEEPGLRGTQGQYWGEVHQAALHARNAAFAWLATGQEAHARDALRRVLDLAAWASAGATSYARADEAARDVAWTLALAYDWLHARLDAEQKQRLLASIRTRVADLYDDVAAPGAAGTSRLAVHPYDSHGSQTLLYLAAISVLLAGDLPPAQEWLREALPLALQWSSPWGGEDGGYANGTAYAQWDGITSVLPWRVLRWGAGVDLARKAWVRNHPRFLAYMLPPGAPVGVFGDGAEQPLAEERARVAKGLARFAPSPLARWHAAQLEGDDASRIEMLLSEPEAGPAALPAGTPDAAFFASIGWVAMHSSLADPKRLSVYFKSSPYGSYNHSHADQNAFVIHAGGERLAIASGYYDGYGTPHWWRWYKQTRAGNAITFDGGQGQAVFEADGELGRGVVTRFEHRADHDVVTGDATSAYGGALTRAERTLVFVRPDLVIVHDVLASKQPRRWEWNLHALRPMQSDGAGRLQIRSGDVTLCVAMHADTAFKFEQTDRFVVPPRGGGRPNQWHGAFVSKGRSVAAEFVAVLRVGCGTPGVPVRRSDCGWVIEAGSRQVSLCRGQVTFNALGSPATTRRPAG